MNHIEVRNAIAAFMKYEQLMAGIGCDLSMTTLGEAAGRCGASFIYDLYVLERNVIWERELLKESACAVRDDPLAPYVNLHFDNDLDIYEWYLQANGNSVGSCGPR